MKNIIKTITIPKSHFEKVLTKAEKLNTEINIQEEYLWNNEDNEEISNKAWDKLHTKVEKLKEKRNYTYSMYSLVVLIDKAIPNRRSAKLGGKDQQIDVTKIFISENTYDLMKEHDRKLLHIIYKDLYSDQKIEKELSMLHLFSGFSISEDAEDNKIYINEGHLRTKI